MTGAEYAEFFTRLGHQVLRTPSAYWYDARPRLYQSLPHARPITLTASDRSALFGASNALGARFPALGDEGRVSYAFMLEGRDYDLPRLGANARSKVRRGLKHCEVERVAPALLRARGRRVNDDTLRRLRVDRDPYDWDRYWDAVAATASIEAWSAFLEGEVAAYVVVAVVDGWAEILTARSRGDLLNRYPNNALIFQAARDLLQRPEIRRLFFGLEPLEPTPGVDQFKASLGFVAEPLRQRVVFTSPIEQLLRLSPVAAAARGLARLGRRREFCRKLEGLLILHRGLPDTREAHKETTWTS